MLPFCSSYYFTFKTCRFQIVSNSIIWSGCVYLTWIEHSRENKSTKKNKKIKWKTKRKQNITQLRELLTVHLEHLPYYSYVFFFCFVLFLCKSLFLSRMNVSFSYGPPLAIIQRFVDVNLTFLLLVVSFTYSNQI